MLRLLRTIYRLIEAIVSLPYKLLRAPATIFLFNPRLGRFRLILAPFVLFVLAAALIAYVVAPIRGFTGHVYLADALRYTDERSQGTAIYDARGFFIGIYDPALDSQEDVNYSGKTIRLPDYIAYPDHKSIHLDKAPEAYWQCLLFQEDRHLGTIWNPFGIDFLGILKIPYTTITKTIATGRPSFGAGGSTLPMQLARIFFKTPPSRNESIRDKLERKLKEWWLAPVIYWELSKGGDISRLKAWSANHFPHAQRTGGQPLYGIEQTSLILFGKPASDLSIAEQYVLAAAVNQPIILLRGSERLNAIRTATWRRIVNERARYCANQLLTDETERAAVGRELTALAAKDPDPKTPAALMEGLTRLAPRSARWADANPVIRSNALVPSAKYGVRDEMKNRFGYAWRTHVRGVHLTLDALENRTFRNRIEDALAKTQKRFKSRINPSFSLDIADARSQDRALAPKVPDVVIAAADRSGRLVRYFESNFNAAYFGSSLGRDAATGRYDPKRESRYIASIGKMIGAIAIANQGGDDGDTTYLDTRAPDIGLEACGTGRQRRSRKAEVSFACSLNTPLAWRLARTDTVALRQLVRDYDVTLPDAQARGAQLARNLVVGQAAASPRTVHRMAGSILSALTGQDADKASYPTLVKTFDRTERLIDTDLTGQDKKAPDVKELIKPESHDALKAFLSAPICYPFGTLRRISDWCADKRNDVTLHFGKTGTWGTGALAAEADDTVDLWVAGGISFASGAAYSYVVLIGSGSPSTPWGRDLYAGAVAEPILRALLDDLARMAVRDKQGVAAHPTAPDDAGSPRKTP